MKILNNMFFSGVMSLGDAIVCYPIAKIFARNANLMYVPSRLDLVDTLTCLYQDQKNIKVLGFNGTVFELAFIEENKLTAIESAPITSTQIYIENPLGYVTSCVNWDRQIYEFYDIPYSARYREFTLPTHIEGEDELYNRLTAGATQYCLVQQQTGDHPAGMGIDFYGFRKAANFPEMKVIEVTSDITSNMIQYAKLIKNATEIHCVNTSFFWLVDSMFNLTKARLFYHDRRAGSMAQINSRWNNNRWTKVTYSERI